MDFNRYFDNEELENILNVWASNHPGLVEKTTLGESYQNKPIWLLKITNQETGHELDKPAIWIDANIHATEIAGTTTALSIAYALLSGYGNDPQTTRLLDSTVYYILPRLNPDGAELAMSPTPRYLRSGVRAYPWEEKEEGLYDSDVDGDGRILQMRIADPNGDWKISSLDPRLLEKRGPSEFGGLYFRLLPEGLIHEFDGYTIKLARALEGLDFNRNFPFQWRPEVEQRGAGPYPTSEPEIKSLVDFITQHNNINLALTFHTYSRVILRPYSTKSDDEIETNDLWVFKRIGALGTQLTGYPCVSTFHDFKYHPKEITTGGFDDWLYDHIGAFTYTIELWDLPAEVGIKDRKFIEWYRDHPHEEDKKILKWVDENIPENGYVDWYPYDHPQLGLVELGGWNHMYTWRNPPKHLMGAEAARIVPFALALGDMLPHLSIQTLQITALDGDDYHVNLIVENSGFLPTYTSDQGKKRNSARPVRVELSLPEGVRLLNGKLRQELGHLEGRSNKLEVSSVWENGPTDNRARAEWVLNAAAGTVLKMKIMSDRAGVIHQDVLLTR